MELERSRYSDVDTARIMRRAAELQRLEEQVSADLFLADLEATAREAGLDPRHVRQAAAELAPGGRKSGGIFGSLQRHSTELGGLLEQLVAVADKPLSGPDLSRILGSL